MTGLITSVDIGSFGRLLGAVVPHHGGIVDLVVQQSPWGTLAPVYVVDVRFQDGTGIKLFVKEQPELGESHPDKMLPNLEMLIYETVLADVRLPVVRYYGNLHDEETGARAICLEFIDDWNLKYHGLDYWYLAARNLGKLHSALAVQSRLAKAADFLPCFDEAYHLRWAERALESVALTTSSLAERVRALSTEFQLVAKLLADQPATLVHNDLSPKNVLADRSGLMPRICFVDWDMAGAGCGLLDLTHLKYGLDPGPDRRMVEAYLDEVSGHALVPDDERDVARLIAACEVQRTMTRLWRNSIWRKPLDEVEAWVKHAETCMRLVAS